MITTEQVFNRLKMVRKANQEEAEEIRDWLLEAVTELKKSITAKFEKSDWTDNPIDTSRILLKYHAVNSGLIGLSEALYERVTYLNYLELIGDGEIMINGKSKKLTQGDRVEISKGRASELKGLKKDLEETQRNLYERIIPYRQAKRF